MPLLVATLAPAVTLIPLVSGTSLVFLALLGGLAARAGGAGVLVGAVRVVAGVIWAARVSVLLRRPARRRSIPLPRLALEVRALVVLVLLARLWVLLRRGASMLLVLLTVRLRVLVLVPLR